MTQRSSDKTGYWDSQKQTRKSDGDTDRERDVLVAHIVERVTAARPELEAQWTSPGIQHMILDDLLPTLTAQALFDAFPAPEQMAIRKHLGEHKHVMGGTVSDQPQLETAIDAFQQPRVVEIIAEIVGAPVLLPDLQRVASGLSLMKRGSFLNPHLDESHDSAGRNYRALNLLYYVTPDWRLCDGGHLELWHEGPDGPRTTILAKFNRLVVIATHRESWHSVSRVNATRHRCCISNYYFSPTSLATEDYYHHTSFRGRPGQKFRDLVLRAELNARVFWRKTAIPVESHDQRCAALESPDGPVVKELPDKKS